jgi:phosphoribosylamine--glycine ligase
MNILIIGGGGREHAIALKISQSPLCTQCFVAPGNPGISTCATCIDISVLDFNTLTSFIQANNISMVIVGPEVPLVAGISDHLALHVPNVYVVGPNAYASQLEGSKSFAKSFMARHNIPTASYFECTKDNLDQAISHLQNTNPPYVLKADGLAAGKGVLIIEDLETAIHELKAMINGKFGEASSCVVIEEFLDGIEFSVFVLTDGKGYTILPMAKDYKRIGEGDTGLNTGGMGAVSPVPFVTQEIYNKVVDTIIFPTIDGFKQDNIIYVGFVFIGLILVGDKPKVIEYNCRLGDPETEVILPRLDSDLVALFNALKEGNISDFDIKISDDVATTVILASGGYPESYESGKIIGGIESCAGSTIYHAGTRMRETDLVTNGGRVLAVTSLASTYPEAIKNSNLNASKITWDGRNYRQDIGKDLSSFFEA